MKNFKNQILSELNNAQNSIKVAVSWITDPTLIDTLIQRAINNVSVEVIMSADQWNVLRYYDFERLKLAGGKVRKYGPENVDENDFMHCKYAIIDNRTVIEGSYNWSKNASTNREQLRIDNCTNRSEELLSDFNYLINNSCCYFKNISNPQEIIEKFKPLEDKFVNPDAMVRKEHEIKLTTAIEINAGKVNTNRNGQIEKVRNNPKTQDRKANKEHRFYGGNVIKYFNNQNQKAPFGKASYQRYHLTKRYDFLDSKIVKGKLISTGFVQPKGCEKYKIKIEWTAGTSPRVVILNKDIEPKNEIHMYKDRSLCLYYPPDLKWRNHLKIADYIVPWVVEWIVFYEIFQMTGKWLGAEAPHDIR